MKLAKITLLALVLVAPPVVDSAAAAGQSADLDEIVEQISAQRIERHIRKLASLETRHTLSETDSDTRGIGAARRWIKSELERCAKESGGRLKVEFDEFVAEAGGRIPKPTTLINVVATLPGEQPESRDRIYVVSGHYDSMPSDVMDPRRAAPGADDDASGTAAVMEMACVMSRYKFDATLVFMAVAGMHVDLIYRRDRYLRGGDHFPFLEQGYPALRFTEPNEDFRHQHQNVRIENGVQFGDLPEFVDFAYVANVARVNAAALAALALGPAAPRDAEIETLKLENDTTLRWRANTEPDLAGYRIIWRETTAPFWQGGQDVGNVTRYTLKGLSKDNLIFAVQAIDKAGNASVATYPRPYRP